MKIKLMGKLDLKNCQELVLRQGDLDGACGPYALTMALIASKMIDKNQATQLWGSLDQLDQRIAFAKAVKELDMLVSQGTDISALQKIFRGIQKHFDTKKIKQLECHLISSSDDQVEISGRKLFLAVVEHIDQNDLPVILWLDWKGRGAHWVVVIGYQYRDNDDQSQSIEHLLILDPGAEMSATGAWNGVLTAPVTQGKKSYRYWSNSQVETACHVARGLAFSVNK